MRFEWQPICQYYYCKPMQTINMRQITIYEEFINIFSYLLSNSSQHLTVVYIDDFYDDDVDVDVDDADYDMSTKSFPSNQQNQHKGMYSYINFSTFHFELYGLVRDRMYLWEYAKKTCQK